MTVLLRVLIWLAVLVLGAAPAWAQAEQIGKGVDLGVHAAGNIVDQGGLIGSIAIAVGCLSLLLHGAQGWAIVSLYKANQALQDKRAAEASDSTKQVASTAISGANAITSSNEKLAGIESRLLALADRIAPLNGDHQRIIANQEKILDGMRKPA